MSQPIHLIPLLFVILSLLLLGQSKKSITNDDVLRMVKAGFEDETILKAIEASEPQFNTSPEALQALDEAGVSARVLSAMVQAARRKTGAAPPAAAVTEGLPEDDGIYVKQGGRYVELPSETVRWGRRPPTAADASEAFRDERGEVSFWTTRFATVQGSQSPKQLAPPFELLIVSPQGVPASDFGLLRAEVEKNRNEDRRRFRFRIRLEGPKVWWDHNRNNVIQFGLDRVSPRKYRVRLPQLGAGEYAFMPPGPIVQEFPQKFYTFGTR